MEIKELLRKSIFGLLIERKLLIATCSTLSSTLAHVASRVSVPAVFRPHCSHTAQDDCAFGNKKNRETFENFVKGGSISDSAMYQIINENPLVEVSVHKTYVNVKILDAPAVKKKSTVQ